MQKNKKIPFRVSARTARLIGRENVATAKGAIIELVKNGYDADSSISIVYFDNYYATLYDNISETVYLELVNKGISSTILEQIYDKYDDYFLIKKELNEDTINLFKQKLSQLATLYIIDTGEGMTQNIISNNWMTIGTDNKASDYLTKSGRIKAGAKGIGRFALDRLGAKCEMITIFNPEYHEKDLDENGEETTFNGYKWIVNWEDFEGEFKTIEHVNAELIGLDNGPLVDYLRTILPTDFYKKINSHHLFKFGTILKITELRDRWDDFYVQQVYSDLEVLAPPKEDNEYELYLFSSLFPNKYGEVLSSICEDFDYKVIAKADANQNVNIQIVRNEYDVELIPNDFFNRKNMLLYPFRKDDFVNGTWQITKTFSQLLPGYSSVDQDKTFNDIGVFEFTFYYLKKSYTSTDADKFFYKKFHSNYRKDWLKKFGGIKLFRDNFRVRPYGEAKDVAFDWLALGSRKANSPAGISKKEGGYRVEPDNVAGSIKISRLTNVNFEDKSSREGLQENKTFQIFKLLIAQIINIFENDRAYIAREMKEFDDERFSESRTKQDAENLAKKILEQNRAKKKEGASDDEENSNEDNKESIVLAELNEKKDEEIEKLKEEQKILRGLASSGIVLASFSHDLSKLDNILESRVDKIKKLISEKISEKDYENIERRKNPFYLLEQVKKQDIKIKNWLNFSLGATRKDKRKRKLLVIKSYFNDFKYDWLSVLERRDIELDISNIEELEIRVFEIDFDSIFNNLLVNSMDAFINSQIDREYKISISIISNSKEIVVDYHDNGPGLSSDISEPEKIFEPLYTTRRNEFTGEEEGTGLGMWLVKSIAEENDGSVKLLYPEEGFGLRITFPIKYKR